MAKTTRKLTAKDGSEDTHIDGDSVDEKASETSIACEVVTDFILENATGLADALGTAMLAEGIETTDKQAESIAGQLSSYCMGIYRKVEREIKEYRKRVKESEAEDED